MNLVPIHEAKAKLSALIALVEKGEEVVLTRHGKRVVRLAAEVQVDDASQRRAKAEAAWARLVAKREAMQAQMGPVIEGYNDLQSLLAVSKTEQFPGATPSEAAHTEAARAGD